MAEETRPSPDALLEEALRETRGRLKIFLGAAPGVGKTYAMLASAKAKREDGTDVVIGVVETHGRAETRMLAQGFETIRGRRIEYRGRFLEEMDLDAILARSPELVLVDELAHTNVPGSRNEKRAEDVAELLAAGIDVISTVNVQHLESLGDVVERTDAAAVAERHEGLAGDIRERGVIRRTLLARRVDVDDDEFVHLFRVEDADGVDRVADIGAGAEFHRLHEAAAAIDQQGRDDARPPDARARACRGLHRRHAAAAAPSGRQRAKQRRMSMPKRWLFSGWNCTPITLPRPIAATKS